MKIYLASPFFSTAELKVYREVIQKLRDNGHIVYVPQEHSIKGAWEMSNADWAHKVFQEDVRAIDWCDVVMVLNFGMYSDSGTAWEAGFAYALNKTVVQVLCGGDNATYSLMMINASEIVVNLLDVDHFEELSARVCMDEVIQK